MQKIATIGFFDGVHRGHRFLFAQLNDLARERELEPLIITFNRHPREVVTGICPTMLTTYMERQRLLALHAQVRVLPFSEVQNLTAEQFMRYLYEEEDVSVLLMGYDHRFGSDQLNGFSEYEKVARRVGLRVERAHECQVDALPVSSTRIRRLLDEGQIQLANRLLGYDYSLTGIVEHGNGIGNQLGFPTANIRVSDAKQLPMPGVYVAHAKVERNDTNPTAEYKAIVNIGNNPTIGNSNISVEAHLIDYQGDLYGETLTVIFSQFIRAEQKFASLNELQKQIVKDLHLLTKVEC